MVVSGIVLGLGCGRSSFSAEFDFVFFVGKVSTGM